MDYVKSLLGFKSDHTAEYINEFLKNEPDVKNEIDSFIINFFVLIINKLLVLNY